MTEHPIIFSGPMVCAILEGRKTQTRRVVKRKNCVTYDYYPGDQWWLGKHPSGEGFWAVDIPSGPSEALKRSRIGLSGFPCPSSVGTRLWVREAFCSPREHIVGYKADAECGAWIGDGKGGRIWMHHGVLLESPAYGDRFAGGLYLTSRSINEYGGKWRSPIHMPRWASRITVEITDVRVQRVQEIGANDAIEEGIDGAGGDDE